jgi:hypothetical protein
MTPIDQQLDALAVIRTRIEGSDDDFLALLAGKDKQALTELLSFTAAFAALSIQELLDKLSRTVSGRALGFSELPPKTVEAYLDSAVREAIKQSRNIDDDDVLG